MDPKNSIKETVQILKSTAAKVNPIDKPINRDDASDTGMESLRLGYTSGKKAASGIKTAEHTIKTTRQTIKTAGNAAKETGKAALKTAQAAARTTMKITKIAADAAVAVIAELASPAILIFAVVIIMFLLLAALVVFVMSGSAAGTTMQRAYQEAAGLVEVDPQYDLGKQLYAQVWNDKRNEFYALIDSLYYDINDLTHSNLAYLERTEPGASKLVFEKRYASDTEKGIMKQAWDFSFPENEMLAIVYVYMEIQENQANGTTDALYPVTYTEEAFRAVIDKCVMFTDTVYTEQYCKDRNCQVNVEYEHNPARDQAQSDYNYIDRLYWDWCYVAQLIYDNYYIRDSNAQQNHWNYTVMPAVNDWKRKYNREPDIYRDRGWYYANSVLNVERNEKWNKLNNTPETITKTSRSCPHEHALHSIGLAFYSAEDVMNALGFSENEKQWVELTVHAFEEETQPINQP